MGDQRGFDAPGGALFFEVTRIARICQPRVLLLENVRHLLLHGMPRPSSLVRPDCNRRRLDHRKHRPRPRLRRIYCYLSRYGTSWRCEVSSSIYMLVINSRLVLPQNRERVYLVCFRKDLYEESRRFQWPIFKVQQEVVCISYSPLCVLIGCLISPGQ